MILAICLSLGLLLLIFTVVTPMKLHLYEIIFIWIVVIYFHQIFYYIVTQNYQFWKTPMQLDLFWGLVITRKVSMPLLLLWFIEFSRRSTSLLIRAALWMVFTSLMVGIDYLMDYAAIVHFVTWSVWNSYAEWFFISAICLLLVRCYCIILRREKFIWCIIFTHLSIWMPMSGSFSSRIWPIVLLSINYPRNSRHRSRYWYCSSDW